MMTGPTVETCLKKAAGELAAAGIDAARSEARLLLAHCLGEAPGRLIAYPERIVEQPAAFDAAVARRAARQPMAQILGQREFWGLPFRVTSDTLDPRPDSETVVQAVLDRIADREAALKIADLGTGTGCLLLSLLSELPEAEGVGVDLSADALGIFRQNAAALEMDDRAFAVQGDWSEAIGGPFDIVVSNPPYIKTHALRGLAPEVADHEPRLALDGGHDGLRAYRGLAGVLGGLLKPSGFAVLELGEGQGREVTALCIKHGLTAAGYRNDLAGRVRCLIVTGGRPENQKKHLEYCG